MPIGFERPPAVTVHARVPPVALKLSITEFVKSEKYNALPAHARGGRCLVDASVAAAPRVDAIGLVAPSLHATSKTAAPARARVPLAKSETFILVLHFLRRRAFGASAGSVARRPTLPWFDECPAACSYPA